MAAVWGSGYSRAAGCGLADGGAASVALVSATSPLEVRFKRSGDGIVWPADGAAVLVGTYGGTAKQFAVRQKAESGEWILIISNHTDAAWQSTDGGGSWVTI